MEEILVHVAAPSSVRDDARYRAQVAAILDFQSTSRHPISGVEAEAGLKDHHSHQVSASDFPLQSLSQHEASPILREASRPAWEVFSDRHLDPEWEERDMDLQNPGDHHIPAQSRDHDSLDSLLSVIPDSQPEIVAPAPDSDSDPDPEALVTSGPAFAEISPPYPPSKRRCMQPQTQTQTQTQMQTQTLGSQLVAQDPVPPAAESDITLPLVHSATDQPAVVHSVQHGHVALGDAPNPICISSSIEESGGSNDSDIPTPAMPNPDPLTLAYPSSTATTTTATAITPSITTATHPLFVPSTLNLTLLLEIHAPQPPISTAPFTTHITPTLSMLTDRLRPERTYKPTQQTRNLDALERGHWFVKFNLGSKEQKRQKQNKQGNQKEEDQIWPHASFETFWKFLNDFIAKDGRAGWGVWCILERSPTRSERISTNPSNADMAESIDDSASVPVSLKIYAWGEIAMHIYLLLFLASERRIRGMGAQWRDAGEHIVLQMP